MHHPKFKPIIIQRHHMEYLDRYCLVGRQGLLWDSCGTLHFLGCSNQGPDHSFIWAISKSCLYSELLREIRGTSSGPRAELLSACIQKLCILQLLHKPSVYVTIHLGTPYNCIGQRVIPGQSR